MFVFLRTVQTGSGKTHTMEGSQTDEQLLGMIPKGRITNILDSRVFEEG